jgi:hypothetical protein
MFKVFLLLLSISGQNPQAPNEIRYYQVGAYQNSAICEREAKRWAQDYQNPTVTAGCQEVWASQPATSKSE